MFKRDITYTNLFTEAEVTETHYFHISKGDMVEMQMEEHDDVYVKDGVELNGMAAKLARVSDSKDGKLIMREIKEMIRRSYGKRVGDNFVKNPEVWAEFESSEAFGQLLFDLCTDAETAADFMNNVMPQNMGEIAAEAEKRLLQSQVAEKLASANTGEKPADPTGVTEPTPPANEDATTARAKEIENATTENPVILTSVEVAAIDSDDLKSGLATGRYKLS